VQANRAVWPGGVDFNAAGLATSPSYERAQVTTANPDASGPLVLSMSTIHAFPSSETVDAQANPVPGSLSMTKPPLIALSPAMHAL
jgi:hypothetical protein